MAWFKRETDKIGAPAPPEERTVKTEGIFVKCEDEDCSATIYRKDLKANLNVCPTCGHHFRLSSRERLQMLFDSGQYAERDAQVAPTDPLEFVDTAPYADRLRKSQRQTGMLDALLTGEGKLGGRKIVIFPVEFRFIRRSIGLVVSAEITRGIERAAE